MVRMHMLRSICNDHLLDHHAAECPVRPNSTDPALAAKYFGLKSVAEFTASRTVRNKSAPNGHRVGYSAELRGKAGDDDRSTAVVPLRRLLVVFAWQFLSTSLCDHRLLLSLG